MIYAVIPFQDEGKLPNSVRKASRAVFDLYAPYAWFVAFDGTAGELADLIWPDDEETSSPAGLGVVAPIDNYSGYASQELWEWLKVRSK